MNSLRDWKKAGAALLKKASGYEVTADDFIIPDEHHGDLAFPCFSLSKSTKRPVADLAIELADAMNKAVATEEGVVNRAVAAGPYINFFLNRDKAAKNIIDDIAAAIK